MELIYWLMMTFLKSICFISSFLGFESCSELKATIVNLEKQQRESEIKYKQSVEAINQKILDEQNRLKKNREEIELRYSGEVIDLKAEETFKNKMTKIRLNNEENLKNINSEIDEIRESLNLLYKEKLS